MFNLKNNISNFSRGQVSLSRLPRMEELKNNESFRKYERPFVTIIYRKILKGGDRDIPIDGAGGRSGMGMCKTTWADPL
ncbi:MAG: hypothetical protein NC926_09450 [Candidatus Omnitrophica bacterium]|nr:hypothetical protein [Candidatus Omnitrophota bacterium]